MYDFDTLGIIFTSIVGGFSLLFTIMFFVYCGKRKAKNGGTIFLRILLYVVLLLNSVLVALNILCSLNIITIDQIYDVMTLSFAGNPISFDINILTSMNEILGTWLARGLISLLFLSDFLCLILSYVKRFKVKKNNVKKELNEEVAQDEIIDKKQIDEPSTDIISKEFKELDNENISIEDNTDNNDTINNAVIGDDSVVNDPIAKQDTITEVSEEVIFDVDGEEIIEEQTVTEKALEMEDADGNIVVDDKEIIVQESSVIEEVVQLEKEVVVESIEKETTKNDVDDSITNNLEEAHEEQNITDLTSAIVDVNTIIDEKDEVITEELKSIKEQTIDPEVSEETSFPTRIEETKKVASSVVNTIIDEKDEVITEELKSIKEQTIEPEKVSEETSFPTRIVETKKVASSVQYIGKSQKSTKASATTKKQKEEAQPVAQKPTSSETKNTPVTRRMVVMNKMNVVNLFNDYLNQKTDEEKEMLQSSISHIKFK